MWWLTRTAQDQLSKADKIIIAVSRGHGSLGPFLEASRARRGGRTIRGRAPGAGRRRLRWRQPTRSFAGSARIAAQTLDSGLHGRDLSPRRCAARHSGMVRLPLLELQPRHSSCRLSRWSVPPRERGRM